MSSWVSDTVGSSVLYGVDPVGDIFNPVCQRVYRFENAADRSFEVAICQCLLRHLHRFRRIVGLVRNEVCRSFAVFTHLIALHPD